MSGRSGAGLEAGGFENVRELLRIIEEFDEMQLAQKRLKTSSMSILTARGSPRAEYLALLLNLLLSLNLLHLT